MTSHELYDKYFGPQTAARRWGIPGTVARLKRAVSLLGTTPPTMGALESLFDNIRKDTWARVFEGEIHRPGDWLSALWPVLTEFRGTIYWPSAERLIRDLDLAIAALPAIGPPEYERVRPGKAEQT